MLYPQTYALALEGWREPCPVRRLLTLAGGASTLLSRL